MSIELFVFIFTICYIALVGIFIIGLQRPRDNDGGARPFVSIVIAARNEEKTLPLCLRTVLNQTYPPDLFEVIVANDNSTDNTEEICKEFSTKHPNFSYINVQESLYALGKANALAHGIEKARGEVILITDADCIVPPTWVEHTARRFESSIGLSGGITLPQSTNWFSGLQTLDWAFTLAMAASTAALGSQHGSIGNNLAFRKHAYNAIGGYRKLKFSVTEDYTLVQAIINTKQWDYIYPIDPNVLVTTQACDTLRSLVRQKHRWGKGALDMKASGFAIFTIGYFMHVSIVTLFLLTEFLSAATVSLVKVTMDYIFLYKFLKKLGKQNELRWFYYFEIYFFIYVLTLPLLVFFGGKVQWKDRKF
ncbi:MAG: glycosyltransferase [Bacteroidetes bacterium]|nr:glycosyltransferase [Bacteroidota bacterium]